MFKTTYMDKKGVEGCTILKVVTGSHAYGFATAESDMDIRGICVPPKDYFLSIDKRFDQLEDSESDTVIYNIMKYFALAAANNPNILEIIFIDKPEHLLLQTKWSDIIRENRQLFLSMKAKHTFSGYGYAQLKRIKSHKKWLMNPPDHQPTREEFGLTNGEIIPNSQLGALNKVIESNQIFDVNAMDIVRRENEFRNATITWNQYQEWKRTRNVVRSELEAQYGYDCYTDDTEFLTDSGWKRYDNVIASDKLATLDQGTHELIFQDFINRVEYNINDTIVKVSTQYSTFNVTKNHKLFVSSVHRQKSNGFNVKYDVNTSNWKLESYESLKNKRNSHYHIRHTVNNNRFDFSNVSDEYLKLIGCFVSEGSVITYKTKKDGTKIKGLSFSQLENGRLCKFIDSISEYYKIHKYTHNRKGRNELTYNIYNKELAKQIVSDCGKSCLEKRLPLWINRLSRRQISILFDAMMSGDGTRKKYSEVYYTYSDKLANDVQLLCFYAGWITKLWTYTYGSSKSYQIYVKRNHDGIGQLRIRGKQSSCIEEKYQGRVVCFEVPNSILVTRLKGEISIQGNTKHACHLVRLMRMGMEILEQGKVIVERPDAMELKAIRNGQWPYEKVIEYAEEMDAKMNALYEHKEKCAVPYSISKDKLSDILMNILDEYWKQEQK